MRISGQTLPAIDSPEVRAAAEAELLALLDADLTAACEQNLSVFVRAAFSILEPGRTYQHNWHIDAMCQHLEAVTEGRIQNLVINVPYRTMKSTVVSVAWPVWTWIQDPKRGPLAGPHVRFLTFSHSDPLATRDSLASRRIIQSRWFQTRWGARVRLLDDQNQKSRYQNEQLGYRLALGVNAGTIGEGGDVILLDDPHDAIDGMYSDIERVRVLDRFDQQISHRVNDPKRGARVVTMQRLHPDDLAGHVLKSGAGYQHLCVPMRHYPERVKTTSIGWRDPRTKRGELLWAARFSAEHVRREIRRLGPYAAAGQLDQAPRPRDGNVFPVDKLRYFDKPPAKIVRLVQVWDTAQKGKEINDPWVGGTWAQADDGGLYLLDLLRDRMAYPRGKQVVYSWHQKWRPHVLVIEDKSTGSSLLQELAGRCAVDAFEPEGDKVTRASVESPAIASGLVYLPRNAEWLHDYVEELASFPNSSTKDQVDMTSMALKWFRENGAGLGAIELWTNDQNSSFAGLGRAVPDDGSTLARW